MAMATAMSWQRWDGATQTTSLASVHGDTHTHTHTHTHIYTHTPLTGCILLTSFWVFTLSVVYSFGIQLSVFCFHFLCDFGLNSCSSFSSFFGWQCCVLCWLLLLLPVCCCYCCYFVLALSSSVLFSCVMTRLWAILISSKWISHPLST